MGEKSGLIDRKNKVLGKLYMRTDRLTGYKYQVLFNTGKHTNSVLTLLNWFHEKKPSYLSSRKLHLSEDQKSNFYYNMIRDVVKKDGIQLEMLQLSPFAIVKFKLNNVMFHQAYHTRNYADLLLIAINRNQQHVQAMANNYRKKSKVDTHSTDTRSNEVMKETTNKGNSGQLFYERDCQRSIDV